MARLRTAAVGTTAFLRRKLRELALLGGVLAVVGAVVLGLSGGFRRHPGWGKADAGTTLDRARPSLVRLSLPGEGKGRADLQRYGNFRGEDFADDLGFCEGFLLENDAVVTTNQCLQGTLPLGRARPFVVTTHDGKVHQVERILGFDPLLDVAFLEVKGLAAYGRLDLGGGARPGELVYAVSQVGPAGPTLLGGAVLEPAHEGERQQGEPVRIALPGASAHNGSPLLDASGRVQGLIVSEGLGEAGLTLALGVDDLRHAHARFVSDRKPKSVTVAFADLPDLRPSALLHALGLPLDAQARTLPELRKKVTALSVTVQVPAAPEAFDTALVTAVDAAVAPVYAAETSWQGMVGAARPLLVPGAFEPRHARLHSFDGGLTVRLPLTVMTPPAVTSAAEPALLPTFPYEALADEAPRVAGDVAEAPEEPLPAADLLAASEPADAPRPLSMLAFKPLVHTRVRPSSEEHAEGREAGRSVSPREVLAGITGTAGLLVGADTRQLRPESQREFLVRTLSEPMRSSEVADGLGRKWQLHSFELFAAYGLDTWCMPLPLGSLCVTGARQLRNEALSEVARRNQTRHTLSRYLVEPAFWDVSALLDYQKQGLLGGDPMMQDFRIERPAAGGLDVELASLGVRFEHPDAAPSSMLRLSAGLRWLEGAGRWVALAHQVYLGEAGKGRLCDVGVAPATPGAPAVASANLTTQTVVSPKTGETLSVVSYCIPVRPATVYGGALEVAADEPAPYKVHVRTM